MPPSTSPLTVARAIAALVLAGLLVRQAAVAGLVTTVGSVTGLGTGSGLGFVGWVALASGAVALAARLLRGHARRELRVAVVGAAVVLGAAAAWNLHRQQGVGAYFTWGFTPDRSGPFPHEPGRVIEEDRQGWRFRTTALADGTRACGSGEDGPVVAFVGDSFMYGSGVPDEGTVCWLLRERLAAQGLTVRGVNLGQPGADLDSTVETVRLAIERYRPAAVVLSVLPGDDARPFDLNRQRAAARSPWFRAAAAVLEAEPVWLGLSLSYEVAPADLWEEVAIRHGMRQLRDVVDDAGVPLIVELLGTNEPWQLPLYEREIDALVASVPTVRRVPLVRLREHDQDPADPVVIPGDGHPTPRGNALRVDGLASVVAEIVRGGAP